MYAAAKDCVLRPGGALRFENWGHDHAVTAGIWRRRRGDDDGFDPDGQTTTGLFLVPVDQRIRDHDSLNLSIDLSWTLVLLPCDAGDASAGSCAAEISPNPTPQYAPDLWVTVLPLVIVLPDISWWYSLILHLEYGQNLYVRSQEMDDPY
jgi:hypothetical protein